MNRYVDKTSVACVGLVIGSIFTCVSMAAGKLESPREYSPYARLEFTDLVHTLSE